MTGFALDPCRGWLKESGCWQKETNRVSTTWPEGDYLSVLQVAEEVARVFELDAS
ncbi:MAG: hypothetical protein U0T82_09415 [Bacteroidales bacterium]